MFFSSSYPYLGHDFHIPSAFSLICAVDVYFSTERKIYQYFMNNFEFQRRLTLKKKKKCFLPQLQPGAQSNLLFYLFPDFFSAFPLWNCTYLVAVTLQYVNSFPKIKPPQASLNFCFSIFVFYCSSAHRKLPGLLREDTPSEDLNRNQLLTKWKKIYAQPWLRALLKLKKHP